MPIKKKVDFQRMFFLFNLEKELRSLFSASLMKTVLFIKGLLLGSYPLQDQPQLSSVNDYQLHFLRRDKANASVLLWGSKRQALMWA